MLKRWTSSPEFFSQIETIKKKEDMLKLYVEIDERIKEMNEKGETKLLVKDKRGQKAKLSISEILTIIVWGNWLGITDKAKLYYEMKRHYKGEFPDLTSYSKFVEASNRVGKEVTVLLAKIISQNRENLGVNKVLNQDSTILPVCKVSRAGSHKVMKNIARKSKNGAGFWYGIKLHVQCDQWGNLCGVSFGAPNVDDRKFLPSMTKWIDQGIIVADKGYLSAQLAYELGTRGIQLITPIRKNMSKIASQFQLACLAGRNRIEELFLILKGCFSLVRSTHRAMHALPIHVLSCFLAYSLFILLIS